MTRLILASASPRRKELLALICSQYEVAPSKFDEGQVSDSLDPEERVLQLAKEKACEVADSITDGIVIGADTVVAIDGQILGKPADEADARRMLRLLSGRIHKVYTGVCVIAVENDYCREILDTECTEVSFSELSDDVIDRYISTGEPLDKAGGYAIQGKGSVLIKGINGCYFNVVGLPIYRLAQLLEDIGVETLDCD